MGKVMDRLKKQLEMEEYREDAKECIIVYNKILEVTEGVSSLTWQELTSVKFKGYPSSERYYSLSPIGKIFYKGIN